MNPLLSTDSPPDESTVQGGVSRPKSNVGRSGLPDGAESGHNLPGKNSPEEQPQAPDTNVSRKTRNNPDKRPKRMKISAKTEYACIAMLELASQYGSSEPVRIRRIAERHDVPPRFLVQILLQLKGAGLVASVRGAAGGYHLIKPPAEVSLGQVMEVIEGAPEENGQSTSASPDSPAVKVLQQAWHDVTTVQRQMLGEVTLAELLERAKEQDEQMYYI